MTRRLTVLVAIAALAGFAGCKDDGEKGESAPAAADKDPAAKTAAKPAKAAKKAGPRSSCDQREKDGVCVDAFEPAYVHGEDHVKGQCTMGKFGPGAACPTADLLGYCDVSDGDPNPAYRIAYYSGGSKNFDAKSAAENCTSKFMGKLVAPK